VGYLDGCKFTKIEITDEVIEKMNLFDNLYKADLKKIAARIQDKEIKIFANGSIFWIEGTSRLSDRVVKSIEIFVEKEWKQTPISVAR